MSKDREARGKEQYKSVSHEQPALLSPHPSRHKTNNEANRPLRMAAVADQDEESTRVASCSGHVQPTSHQQPAKLNPQQRPAGRDASRYRKEAAVQIKSQQCPSGWLKNFGEWPTRKEETHGTSGRRNSMLALARRSLQNVVLRAKRSRRMPTQRKPNGC